MDEREKALQCSHGTWTFSSQSYPFGGNQFIIPAMLAILGVLTVLRKPLEKAEVSV